MRNMLGVHFHPRHHEYNENMNDIFSYFDTTQVLLSSTRRFEVTTGKYYIPPKNKTTIAHASFVLSLVKDDKDHYVKSMNHLVNLSSECIHVGAEYIVVHPGGYNFDQSRKPMEVLHSFVQDWLQATNNHETILCLENTCGAKNGRYPASLTFLYNYVSRLNHPRIKICYDTNHAWGNGFDLNKKQTHFLLNSGHVGVVHLNCIPNHCKLGGHLDRHGTLPIQEGQKVDELVYTYQLCQQLQIPCILERDPGVWQKDYEFLMGNKFNLSANEMWERGIHK